MKLIIDDANLELIKSVYEFYPIDGVTTNPSILAKSGRKPYEVLKEIRAFIGEEAELHVQAIGAADEKDQMLGGGLLPICHDLGQFLTGAQLSLHTESYQTGAGRELGADGIGLLGQSLVDLALGGVLRQLLLGQLGEGELTVAAQPLFVLLAGLQIELLLQLSHTDEMNAQHTAASCLTP